MAYLEWIDACELSEVQQLADGGYGSVYTAIAQNGARAYGENTEIGVPKKKLG
jgi:hypothetical protein